MKKRKDESAAHREIPGTVHRRRISIWGMEIFRLSITKRERLANANKMLGKMWTPLFVQSQSSRTPSARRTTLRARRETVFASGIHESLHAIGASISRDHFTVSSYLNLTLYGRKFNWKSSKRLLVLVRCWLMAARSKHNWCTDCTRNGEEMQFAKVSGNRWNCLMNLKIKK